MEFPDYDELQKYPKYSWDPKWFSIKFDSIKNDLDKLNRMFALMLHHYSRIHPSKSLDKVQIPFGGKVLHGGKGIHFGHNNIIPSDLAHILCSYLHVVTSSDTV